MQGRNPMKGRHNVGGRTGSAGTIRGGQSEPASNKGGGITGSTSQMRPKPPVLANQAKTSETAQRAVKRPPMPFADPQGSLNTKAASGPKGAKPGGESVANPKGVYAGKSGNTVGSKALPSGSPVGYSKLPNQSKQIGGRMSAGSNPRRRGDNGSGYPAKKGNAFYGE